jgi:hypothetical protein
MNFKNFHVSKDIRKKLRKKDAENIEKKLWDKTGGKCSLCDEKLDQENDYIVPDHEIPQNDSGPTTLDNLNPAHSECNSFKQDNPSVDVRPFLKLKRKIDGKEDGTQFDGVLEIFNKGNRKVNIVNLKDKIQLDTGSGAEIYPIFHEKKQSFIYANVPIVCLTNDRKCQPRNINLKHLWSIFKDIQRNPLHEAPTCRLCPSEKSISKKLLIFDGQHKAVAFLLDKRDSICTKIYLDLDEAQANYLIGSIQSKIKKLPLSPFEFTRKMERELEQKWNKYIETASDPKSEKNFISSIPAPDRKRAKIAFNEALCAQIIDDESLQIRKHVKNKKDKNDLFVISEQAFKQKVVFTLLHSKPLADDLGKVLVKRENEGKNIRKLLNIFYAECFLPKDGNTYTGSEKQKIKLMSYQGSLLYLSTLLKNLMSISFKTEPDDAFLLASKISPRWKEITSAIQRLSSHPFWIAPRAQSTKINDLHTALEKNQNVQESFKRIGLDVGYLLVRDDDPEWDKDS